MPFIPKSGIKTVAKCKGTQQFKEGDSFILHGASLHERDLLAGSHGNGSLTMVCANLPDKRECVPIPVQSAGVKRKIPRLLEIDKMPYLK